MNAEQTESPTAVHTLYVFPHAGGSAGSYVPFSRAFSADMRRIAVQYPGRTDRHDVPDIASIPALADDVYKMLAPQTGADVAFFGHSMGGLVAFEVARRFEAAGTPIAALFLSASPAPGSAGYEYLNQSSDEELLKMVTEMTGMDAQFIDERFGATILRTLRSYGTITDYRCPAGTTISSPIYAYAAADDTVVSQESVAAWSDFTTSDFALRVLPGNHFYVTHDVQALVEDMQHRMAPSPA
ncbi:thioesterase II family protein [Mycobacterium sp. E2733]|uniref:thioesterase II family protein n=1 Tax=Mycobacterium sp. E2733 TaxID=1834138 RepID=UPI0007FB79CC|nr:alpha/beta fold hydrolase [Mycobacterium sp. E2733]OBH92084.1 thioesterase [Mycobacterium sp. E2733]